MGVFAKLTDSLDQRRARQPYGLHGGEHAQSGRNLWIKRLREEDGDLPEQTRDPAEGELPPNKPRIINIGGKATVLMGKGDRLVIETPGGGGWGTPKV